MANRNVLDRDMNVSSMTARGHHYGIHHSVQHCNIMLGLSGARYRHSGACDHEGTHQGRISGQSNAANAAKTHGLRIPLDESSSELIVRQTSP